MIFGDNKYNNLTLQAWLEKTQAPYRVEVRTKAKGEEGFKPIPIRWVVEQSFACLGRCRRLTKDHEYETTHSEAWVQISAIQIMARRLCPNKEKPQAEFRYRKNPTKVA